MQVDFPVHVCVHTCCDACAHISVCMLTCIDMVGSIY